MKKFRIKYFFLAVLSGCLLAISFPKINAFYFAWIAFIPIIYSSLRNCVRNSLIYGFIFGFTCYAISLYWMFPFLKYNINTTQAIICSVLLWSYLSLYFSLWSAMLSFSRRHLHPVFSSLYAASSWVFLEYIRTYLFTGFGWNLIGYSQSSFTYIIQIADITGVYGISFLIIFFNMLLYYYLKDFKEKKYLISVVCIFVGVSIYGYMKIYTYSNPYGEKISVGVIQPNIDQYKKWDKQYSNEILDNLRISVENLGKEDLDLIVYPETTLPGFIEYEKNIIDFVKEVSNFSRLSLIGGASYDGQNIYNSIFVIKEDSSMLGKHDKNHLVVFGEYIPFRNLLSKYFGILNSLGDFSKGKYMNPFKCNDISIGTTICSENFFPNLSRKLVLNGAKILTNHTNDAWFFDSFAPHQHFAMNIFRAVENRKNVIVSANTGISAVIDSAGNVLKKTNINERISFSFNAYQNNCLSYYSRIGDCFSYICMAFTFFILVVVFIL